MAMAMEFEDLLIRAARALGFISLTHLVFTFFKFLWDMFLRPPKNFKKYGSWALITGSTDGIGKPLSLDFASRGLNLVLVGRTPSKLEAISNEIHKRYGKKIDTKIIVIDFTKVKGENIGKAIEKGIQGLDIGVLVNNFGTAYPYAKFSQEVDFKMIESLVNVNVEGATWVTKAVLTGMLKKKKGAIVNIGSGSTVVDSSCPLNALYTGTKMFISKFSKGLAAKYKKQGIDVQCQVPLLVATSIRKSSLFIPSFEEYSKASIRWIGYEQGICMPYWPHYVQWTFASVLPDAFQDCSVFRYYLGMRRRGLMKASMIAKANQKKKNPCPYHFQWITSGVEPIVLGFKRKLNSRFINKWFADEDSLNTKSVKDAILKDLEGDDEEDFKDFST